MKNLVLQSQGFNIFGLFVTWYGVIISLAMILGVVVAILLCKKKGLDTSLPIDLALFALPCAIVGARLYYCIFYGVSSFVEIFEIWKGGMAIYGGVIGGFLGILICCKIKKLSLAIACDVAAPSLILGQSIGRIGCYFAGCCYGVETTLESLKIFPLSVQIEGIWHLATFFYESFFDLIGFFILMLIAVKTDKKGVTTSSYLIYYGVLRAILEIFRDQSEALMLGSTGIKVSLLLSVILVVVGVMLLVVAKKAKNSGGKVNV